MTQVEVIRKAWAEAGPPCDPPHVDAIWSHGDRCWIEKDESLRRRIKERTASEKACAVFGEYAAMDAPDLPDNRLDAIQVRLCRWQVNKFGSQPFERMALGIIEELGELQDANEAGWTGLQLDAVGDICVYTSQLLTHHRLSLSSTFAYALEVKNPPLMLSAAGKLSHVVLKRLQRIRGMQDIFAFRAELFGRAADVLAAARKSVEPMAEDLEGVLERVANHVMRRKGEMLPETA